MSFLEATFSRAVHQALPLASQELWMKLQGTWRVQQWHNHKYDAVEQSAKQHEYATVSTHTSNSRPLQ